MNKQKAIPLGMSLPFPDGRVWAAVRSGKVVSMVYMHPVPVGVTFEVFRDRSRSDLSRHGAVWTGEVRFGEFFPKFASTDRRAVHE